MSDPVSDFLAREQNALADLNDDPLADAPAPAENGLLGVGGQPAEANHDLLTNGGDSGVDLSALDGGSGTPAGGNNSEGPLSNGRGPSPTARSSYRQPEEEPEKIRKWREAQKQAIAEKDKAEEKKKEELRVQAKKELDEWEAQRKKRLEQRKKDNREREAQYREEALGGLATGKAKPTTPGKEAPAATATNWSNISKMMDSGAKSARGTKDTTRMRTIIHAYKGGSPTPVAE